MSIDFTIGGSISQGWQRQSSKANSFHLVRLRTPIHGETEHNRQQVADPSTWCLIVIYVGYWSSVDSQQWDVESTLKMDFERANIPMGPNGPLFELIYLVGMGYESQIGSRFTFMHKGVLVIM